MISDWYTITSDGATTLPMRERWRDLLIADMKRRGKGGTFRRCEAPARPVADVHAFGSHDGRRRCGARGVLAESIDAVTCDVCRALLHR